jgi:hypothetical protein
MQIYHMYLRQQRRFFFSLSSMFLFGWRHSFGHIIWSLHFSVGSFCNNISEFNDHILTIYWNCITYMHKYKSTCRARIKNIFPSTFLCWCELLTLLNQLKFLSLNLFYKLKKKLELFTVKMSSRYLQLLLKKLITVCLDISIEIIL